MANLRWAICVHGELPLALLGECWSCCPNDNGPGRRQISQNFSSSSTCSLKVTAVLSNLKGILICWCWSNWQWGVNTEALDRDNAIEVYAQFFKSEEVVRATCDGMSTPQITMPPWILKTVHWVINYPILADYSRSPRRHWRAAPRPERGKASRDRCACCLFRKVSRQEVWYQEGLGRMDGRWEIIHSPIVRQCWSLSGWGGGCQNGRCHRRVLWKQKNKASSPSWA